MTVTYRIKDWEKHFEKAQSRGVKCITWVATPNKHDGKVFNRIMALDDGLAIYGAWHLILQVASKCPVRGTLADDDGPMSADDIADKTCGPEKREYIEKALNLLCQKRFGWIEKIDADSTLIAAISTSQHVGATGQDITGHNKTEQIPPSEVCSEPPSDSEQEPKRGDPAEEVIMVFPCVGRGPTEWPLYRSKLAELGQSFPAVDVLGECRAARQWCLSNPTKRKTFSGVERFLVGWMTRAQNDGRRPRNGAHFGNASSANGKARVDSAKAPDGTGKYDKFTRVDSAQPAGNPSGAIPVAGSSGSLASAGGR